MAFAFCLAGFLLQLQLTFKSRAGHFIMSLSGDKNDLTHFLGKAVKPHLNSANWQKQLQNKLTRAQQKVNIASVLRTSNVCLQLMLIKINFFLIKIIKFWFSFSRLCKCFVCQRTWSQFHFLHFNAMFWKIWKIWSIEGFSF